MSKKVIGNNVDFSASEIAPKKVRGNNVDFSTIEITSKKSTWKRRGFFDRRNYMGKVRGNDVEICRIWSSTFQLNIDLELMSIRRGVPIGMFILTVKCTLLSYASYFQY